MSVKNVDKLIRDFWENRAIGIVSEPLDVINEVTLAYLRARYPYLQLISMDAKFEETVIPQFKQSSVGWVIHDYGQALSSSPGKYLYGPGNPELPQEDEEGSSGIGTLTRQTVETAKAMIELAIAKGWPGVEIISGTALMQWAALLAAQDKNYPLAGYTPSNEEQKRLEKVKRIRAEGKIVGSNVDLGKRVE